VAQLAVKKLPWWPVVAVAGVMLCSLALADLKFSGYAQYRYNAWDSDLAKKPDTLDLRRMRLTLQGPATSSTTLKLQIEVAGFDDPGANTAIEWKDWYLAQRLSRQLSATLGFTSASFGLEVPTSNANLLPLERSQAALTLFPGEREIGAYLHWTPAGARRPQVSVGYTGGMKKWWEADKSGNEDQDTRATDVRMQWPLSRKGVVGASYRKANRTRKIAGVERQSDDGLFGLHTRLVLPRHWALQGEVYDGQDLGVDVRGWYGQTEYAFAGTPVTAYYRFDEYDSGGASDYRRHTAGVAWARTKTEQTTLQGETYEDGKGGSFVNYALQYQVSY
jgi:hypothetical protein